MALYDIALRMMDQLIARSEANTKSHGYWWGEQAVTLAQPTPEELTAKLASVQRRLDKAEAAFTAALAPGELVWHRTLQSDPKSMADIEERKKALKALYAMLKTDEHKLKLYRQFSKLKDQHGNLQAKLNAQEEGPASVIQEEKTPAFQLAVDYPNEVDSQPLASAVTALLHQALVDVGGDVFAMPSAYFKKGKLVLEIEDPAEELRQHADELNQLDWQSVRAALVKLKPELESKLGWKRRPAKDGDVLEKIDPLNDLQVRILDGFVVQDWDDTSHWDMWVPSLPGEKISTPVDVQLADEDGEKQSVHDLLKRKVAEPGEETYLEPTEYDQQNTTGSFALDPTGLQKKATVRLDAAKYYLQDLLGIQGLDLAQRSADEQRGR